MIQRELYFQYLVTLAAAGEASEAELKLLGEHVANCSSCSQRMAETESTNLHLFLTLAGEMKEPRISSKMQERFLIRAAHSGVPMATASVGFQHSNLLQFAALFVAVCLLFGLARRHFAPDSLATTTGPFLTAKTTDSAHVSTVAASDLATSHNLDDVPSINKRLKHHAPEDTAAVSSVESGKESGGVSRRIFRLDTALFPTPARALDADARLADLRPLPTAYFRAHGEDPEPWFSSPNIYSSSMESHRGERVFHYSATLASLSLQDDQAVFGLKPRVRDLSSNNTWALNHFK